MLCVGGLILNAVVTDTASGLPAPSATSSTQSAEHDTSVPNQKLLSSLSAEDGLNSAHKTEYKLTVDHTSTSPTRKLVAPPGVIIQQDVAYLPADRAEKLDLYLPEHRAAIARSPAILNIHGGGWSGGDKAGRREYVSCCALAAHGYVCVSVEYMKKEGRRWPTNLHDCKNAVRWLRVNADRLQVDPDRIGVIGGSAGGHLAMMVAYTSKVPELEPASPYPGISNQVTACVNLYGIANVATRQGTDKQGVPDGKIRNVSALFPETLAEAPEKWKRASPVTYVTRDCPPTLTIHGTGDTTVDRDQAHELNRLLTEHGVEHEYIELPGVGHAFALDASSLPRDLRPEMIAFFDKHLSSTAALIRNTAD
ncbi:MAG: alpha/beta hydrolase fold domain-containing protein [Candidatus Sumerlaeaceae bacterium]